MNDYDVIPAGEYRIILQDVSGEIVENFVRINPRKIRKDYPVVRIKDGKLTLTGSQPAYAVRLYDKNHNFLNQLIFNTDQEIDIEQEIRAADNIQKDSYLEVFYFDTKQDAGFCIGPYFF